MRRRVAVIGGGISGLAAAHRLLECDPSLEVTVLEATGRLGGVLETVHRDGFLIEGAADNFLTTVPAAVDLCRRIGLQDDLVPTDESRRQAFVVRRGRLEPIPPGFVVMTPSQLWPVLSSPILSVRGKLRLALEYLVPPKSDEDDESVASFARRRFGRETYERLVQPLVGGIYTADPERLSLQSTLPRFRDMEREHGSLLRAMLRKRKQQPGSNGHSGSSGARYSMFVAPREGMSSVVEAVARRLPPQCVRLSAPVMRITPHQNGWDLFITGEQPGHLEADGVILATPAYHSAQLLSAVDATLSHQLTDIPYAGCIVVSLGYLREQIGHPLDGFGAVVPLIEGRQVLSCSFSSVKYPGRAPEGAVLLRLFVGGACQSELLELPDEQVLGIAQREAAELLEIRGEPILHHVSRRERAMPQYHVGHQALVGRIEARAGRLPGLALAGNAFGGVGIPTCIQSGERAAERVFAQLSQNGEAAARITQQCG